MSSQSKQLKQSKLFGWQASIDGKNTPKMMGISDVIKNGFVVKPPDSNYFHNCTINNITVAGGGGTNIQSSSNKNKCNTSTSVTNNEL